MYYSGAIPIINKKKEISTMKKLIALLMALCMILGVASVSAEDVAYERA